MRTYTGRSFEGMTTVTNPTAGTVASAIGVASGKASKTQAVAFRVLDAGTYTVTIAGAAEADTSAYLAGEGYELQLTDISGTGRVRLFW